MGKKTEKRTKTEKDGRKKPEIIKTCLDILPIRSYDARLSAFRLADGSLMDTWQILPRDLDNMDEDELQMEIYHLMKIFKTVGCDLKFISMKFPLDLTGQKAILQRRKAQLQDEPRQIWLDRQYRELELAEQHVSTLHFYLVFFGKNEDELIRHRDTIRTYAGTGAQRLVAEITAWQKRQVIKKLCNMNTQIDLSGEEANRIEELEA